MRRRSSFGDPTWCGNPSARAAGVNHQLKLSLPQLVVIETVDPLKFPPIVSRVNVWLAPAAMTTGKVGATPRSLMSTEMFDTVTGNVPVFSIVNSAFWSL